MTHPNDAPLKPSDEARRLVEAYGLEQYFLGQEGIVHGDKDPTAEALLAYIAALEATPQNAGEAKPVAERIEKLEAENVRLKGQRDAAMARYRENENERMKYIRPTPMEVDDD